MLDPNAFPKLEGPVTFVLESGVELHEESPDTFPLPPVQKRRSLKPGDLAKLVFRITDGEKVCVERMWVIVRSATPEGYIGTLDNDPYCTQEMQSGLEVEFSPDHVIGIDHAA